MPRWLRTLLLALAALYVVACAAAYLAQERLLFHPRAIAPDAAIDWGDEVWVRTPDGDSLHTVWVDRPGAEEVVLYFHGNVGDVNRARYQLRRLLDGGRLDVVAVDYRSFGKSPGPLLDDAQLLADAQAVYEAVAARYGEDRVRLLGYSLGTGMAAHVAAANAPASLTLVAPYTSLVDMKDRWFWWLPDALLKYRLDTRARLPEVSCPVAIYHGTADRLIPFAMAEELRRLSPKWARLHALSGVSHRGAILALEEAWVR